MSFTIGEIKTGKELGKPLEQVRELNLKSLGDKSVVI